VAARLLSEPNGPGADYTRLPMSIEDRMDELGSDRCEECGARLTPAELEAVRESGGPVLCSIHAAEDEPGLAAADSDPDGS
jgi:hypothetical protein